MKVIHKLRMDLARCGCRPIVGAVQGEANARVLEVSLYNNGAAWEIPEAAAVQVAFQKPDGTQGIYSKLPDDSPATTFSGNILSATLAPQMLTCAGTIRAAFLFHNEGQEILATFPFTITVEASPAAGAELSEDYYNPTVSDIEAEVQAVLVEVQAISDAVATAEAAAAAAQAAAAAAQESASTAATEAAEAATAGAQQVVDAITPESIGARPDTWTPTAEEVGATPASHAENTNNPHAVTAAQAGARPDTWLPTIAEIGAAPAGYGLGTYDPVSISTDEQINSATRNGWYRVSASTMNFGGYTDGNGALFVAAIRNDRVWQTMYFKNSNTIARRVCASGTWGEWELENPPMNLGVEYRTTERYQGKPVYTACFSCGNLPASGGTETPWSPPSGGFAHIFASHVTYGDNQGSVNGLGYKAYSHNYNEIRIDQVNGVDWSSFTATAIVKYWKE